ncbi:MAG: tetratricopeptide repeat protein [Gammaproteobacteria bacterium]|nr:tetratricopeptide repeat protein [Gammaproteobacteria bacterium]
MASVEDKKTKVNQINLEIINNLIPPKNIYVSYLKTIHGIAFTSREIDIIACLLRGRRSSKIASLLSIAVRNVENRIAGIKLKLGCGSQEGIIDFIEKSGKLLFMNQYYTSLLIEIAFERALKKLSVLNSQYPVCHIVYDGEEKDNLFMPRQLKKHLALTGLNLLEVKENYHTLAQSNKEVEPTENPIICCLSASLIEKDPDLFSFFRKNNPAGSIIFLCLNPDVSVNIPTAFLNDIQMVDLTKQQNYYLLVFDVLKILLTSISFEESILDFKKYCTTVSDNSINHLEEEKGFLQDNNTHPTCVRSILTRRKVIGLMGAVLLLFCINSLYENVVAQFWQMKPQESTAPIKDTKTWNIPRQDHVFVGREHLLKALEAKLHPSLPPAISVKGEKERVIRTVYPVSVCAGMGGVGKTQLALQYVHHSKHIYSLIAWFASENLDQLKQQYIEFAKALGYKEENPSIKTALPYVKEWLSRHPGWLLIYDNVNSYNEIKDYLPTGQGSMVLTTRQQKWPSAFETLDVDVMTEEESIQLIQSLIHRKIVDTEEKAAKELVNMLGCLPLAIAQASAYIHETHITIIDYLNLYQSHEQALLEDSTLPEGTNSLPIAATWNISLEAMAKEAKEKHEPLLALALLNVCAYLAPEKISRHLLLTWFKESYPKLTSPELVLPKLIAQLWRYSLINMEEDGSITVHRLVQAVVRHQHQQTSDQKNLEGSPLTLEWYGLLVKSIHSEFNYKTHLLEDELRQKKLLPHLQMLLNHYKKRWPTHSEWSLIPIINDIGTVFSLMSDPKTAKFYYERALPTLEKHYGKDHLEVAHALNQLGRECRYAGYLKEAKELHERALKIQEQFYGKDHPEIANSLNQLGRDYSYLGDARKAKELHERVLKIQEPHYGINHVEIADILHQLGRDYRDLGDAKKAKELHERALEIQEQFYGKDHPEIAYSIDQLGRDYRDLGDVKKAKELHERALKIQEPYYDRDHIEAAHTLHQLGRDYADLGDAKKAKELHEHALKIQEQFYGKDHIAVAQTLYQLGRDYRDLGDAKKAKEFHERALEIQEPFYGKEHVEVAQTLHQLGRDYADLGDAEKAKELHEHALKIKEPFYDKSHPTMADAYTNLGSTYTALNNAEQGKIYLENALAIKERYYGMDHQDLIETLTGLGKTYKSLKNLKQAQLCFDRALKIRRLHLAHT